MPNNVHLMPHSDAPSSQGNPLPANLQHNLESAHGVNLSDVKVHVGHEATLIGAKAFTQGSDIHLAPGQEQHLPHEAWHVAQQKQGRVESSTLAEGLVEVREEQSFESSEGSSSGGTVAES